MAYQQRAYSKYNSLKKKLPQPLQKELNRQEDLIVSNPLIGEVKSGELEKVRVHKFRMVNQLYLLAYLTDHKAQVVTFLAVGGHENFYRDLERYLQR
ncbi:MAG TPA: type II toxin-antitoxin system RelE/ParE family toxin [Candidatus Fraserbacteria bacterium]|nr:type II toxin-antitoxin system RelE/ParE family toxin [Candidatus Fraserbacteria bacterium]